jgi:hypothetical protein
MLDLAIAAANLVAPLLASVPPIPPPRCPPPGGFLEETLRFVVGLVRILLGARGCG